MGRPSREPGERTVFLDDNLERLWGRVHTKQGRLLREPFRCDRNQCSGTSNVFKLIHLLYQEARDSQGACTEHLCYECWLITATPRQNTFWNQKKGTCKWKYTCLEDDGQWDEDAWGSSLGAYAEAVSNLEAQKVEMPEECEDKKPLDQSCDPDALRAAQNVMVEDNPQDMKGLKGMTSCLEVLLEVKAIFGDCSRHRLEKARLQRWTSVSYARQVGGQAGRKGAFTMAHMCTLCQLMPKDDLMWYLAKDKGHKGIGRKMTGKSIHGAFCGDKGKAKDMSCVVTELIYGVHGGGVAFEALREIAGCRHHGQQCARAGK